MLGSEDKEVDEIWTQPQGQTSRQLAYGSDGKLCHHRGFNQVQKVPSATEVAACTLVMKSKWSFRQEEKDIPQARAQKQVRE